MNHQWQTLNNCHNASIATLLGYYDVWFTQHEIDRQASALVDLHEFVSPYGLTARIYTTIYSPVPIQDVVRWLLAEDIPVIVGQSLSLERKIWHYRVARGYDDAAQEFILDDPLLGPNIRISYDTFARLSMSATVVPVYPVEKNELIETTMYAWQMKLVHYVSP
jgi:hypothetical protein